MLVSAGSGLELEAEAAVVAVVVAVVVAAVVAALAPVLDFSAAAAPSPEDFGLELQSDREGAILKSPLWLRLRLPIGGCFHGSRYGRAFVP